jgi:hypothetical protein
MTKRCEVVTPWERVGNTNEMQVALNYPATWTDVTGQHDEYILNGVTAFVAAGEKLSDAQMAALLADARFVVLWSETETDAPPAPADLTAPQVDALKTKIAAVTHSDVAAFVTDATAAPLVIAGRLVEAQLRPPWQAGLNVAAGEVYAYEGNLYEVIQAHRTQSDWTPVVAKALFKRFHEPTDDPWPWIQPAGAHDSYPIGARVTHGGFTWSSNIAANVWEPGSVGAEALWTNLTPPPQTAEWAVGVAYKVNDEVTYQGSTYRCRQAHTSIVTWTPPATPALWLKL